MLKRLFILFAIVALATGFEFAQRLEEAETFSISSEIVKAIEDIQKQMPCGFPAMGIPPLAPLLIDHQELNIDNDFIKIFGAVDKVGIHGLDQFEIVEFKVSPVFSRVTFRFVWNHVHLNALYEALIQKGKIKLNGNGVANMDIKGLHIWGQLKYKLGVTGGNFQIKEFKVYAQLDEVNSDIQGLASNKYVNRVFNKMIEEWIMLAINDNTENLAEKTNTILVPMMNDMIGDMSLKDIIGIVGGGGGGGEKPEKKECVPGETYWIV